MRAFFFFLIITHGDPEMNCGAVIVSTFQSSPLDLMLAIPTNICACANINKKEISVYAFDRQCLYSVIMNGFSYQDYLVFSIYHVSIIIDHFVFLLFFYSRQQSSTWIF